MQAFLRYQHSELGRCTFAMNAAFVAAIPV